MTGTHVVPQTGPSVLGQIAAVITTVLKSGASTALAIVITFGTHVLDQPASAWKTVLAAAIAAAAVTTYNWLNPLDGRYGVGAGAQDG